MWRRGAVETASSGGVMRDLEMVDEAECALCRLEAAAGGQASAAFAHGYIAGRSAICEGAKAEERFCSNHASVLSTAVTTHIGNGIRRRRST